MGLSDKDRILVTEIRAWLLLSNLFFRAFQIQKHLGPEWFVINSLLAPAKGRKAQSEDRSIPLIAFSDLLNGLPGAAHKHSSKNHDLSACLEHLRELGHIEIFESKKRTLLKGRSAFPVHKTHIKVQQKLVNATRRYTRACLREFYDLEFAEPFDSRFVELMRVLYDFGRTTLFTEWVTLLTRLARESPLVQARDAFEHDMVGSSEYFVLLLALWELKLLNDDDEGYRREMLLSLHRFTRQSRDTVLKRCVDQLTKHKVLEQVPLPDQEPHYRLSRRHDAAFEVFGNELASFRSALRSQLEKAFGIEINKNPAHLEGGGA